MYRSQGNFTGHGKVGYSGCEVNFHCPYGRRSIGPMPSCLYIHVLSIYTELAKRACPRLRDSACWRSGDITQPMTKFLANSIHSYCFVLVTRGSALSTRSSATCAERPSRSGTTSPGTWPHTKPDNRVRPRVYHLPLFNYREVQLDLTPEIHRSIPYAVWEMSNDK